MSAFDEGDKPGPTPDEDPLGPDWVRCTSGGHVRATVGAHQAAEVMEKFRQLCPQLSPECDAGAFPTFGP